MKFQVTIDRDEDGVWVVECPAIPGCVSQGDTRTAALANIKEATNPDYVRNKARLDYDLGPFPWERVNPNGGSVAIGHPFAATGARILSQAAKELGAMPKGSRAIVSVCADGGQGTVALLERA